MSEQTQRETEMAQITEAWTDGQYVHYEAEADERGITGQFSRGALPDAIITEDGMAQIAEQIVGCEVEVLAQPDISSLLGEPDE